MKNVLILSNIPAPYRTALFSYMQSGTPQYRYQVLYTSHTEADRAWKVSEEELKDTYFLDSKILRVKGGKVGGTATRYIHIPYGLSNMLNRLKPQVIIGGEYNLSAVRALLWAKRHGVPYINMTDGTLRSEAYIGRVQRLTRKIIIGKADAYLASGTRAKEKLLYWGAPEEKIAVAYLTVDVAPFVKLARQPREDTILYVGRISREKGLDLLVEALAAMENKTARLRVVGNDVDGQQAEIQALAHRLGVSGRIDYLGYREGEALLSEYAKARVLAVPSRSDCFGLILVEAGCAGLPVSASIYADGACDVITPGENGLMADPEKPEEFAAALDTLLRAPEVPQALRAALGEKFSFAAVAKGYDQAVSIAEGGGSHG